MEQASRSKTLRSETLSTQAIQAKSYDDVHNTFTVPCKKSETVSFTSAIMKSIVAPSTRSRFPVKLICCIASGSASSASYLLKSVAIILL